MQGDSLPVSTRWLLDAVGDSGRLAVQSVYMLTCRKTQMKGTGFLIKQGHVVTNWHVVQGNSIDEIQGISNSGTKIDFSRCAMDPARDLAALTPAKVVEGGLTIAEKCDIRVGTQLATWGYPLGYNGPAPLLSVGYLSGFNDSPPYEQTKTAVKHLVVNGAFNPGNSGGPLFISGSNEVIGVVVSKHAPITPFVRSAIQALADNQSGIVFTTSDGQGKNQSFVESQVVAEILLYFRQLTQVMIGEAVAASELIEFLKNSTDVEVCLLHNRPDCAATRRRLGISDIQPSS